MHTQSHWSCSKCHKSVRKVIKEIPFLSEFWQKIFFSALTTLEGERGAFVMPKNEKEAKSRLHKIFCNCTKDQKNGLCKKKVKMCHFFLKPLFRSEKAFGRLNFIFAIVCFLLDQWKTAKENIFWISWISTESSRKSLMRSNCRCRWHDVTVGRPRRYKSRLKWTWVWPPQTTTTSCRLLSLLVGNLHAGVTDMGLF